MHFYGDLEVDLEDWSVGLRCGEGPSRDKERRYSLNSKEEGRLRAGQLGREKPERRSGLSASHILMVSVTLVWGQEPQKVLSKGVT